MAVGRKVCTKLLQSWPNWPWPSNTPITKVSPSKVIQKSSWFGLCGLRPFLHANEILYDCKKASPSCSTFCRLFILSSNPFYIISWPDPAIETGLLKFTSTSPWFSFPIVCPLLNLLIILLYLSLGLAGTAQLVSPASLLRLNVVFDKTLAELGVNCWKFFSMAALC